MTYSVVARGAGRWVGLALLVAGAPVACMSGDPEVCLRGQQVACACDGGRGLRVCDGSARWGECSCANVAPPQVGPCLCAAGCCGVGACLFGNAAEACGGDGQRCLPCAAGDLCVGRVCVAAPATGLTLRVVSASVPSFDPSKRGCSNWDCGLDRTGAAPDVFVRQRGGHFRTVVAWDLYAPVWDEDVATGLTPEQLAEPIALDVLDADPNDPLFADQLPPENLVARFEIHLPPEQRAPGRIVVTSGASASSLVTLTLELR